MKIFEKLSIKGKFTFILVISMIMLLFVCAISSIKAIKANSSTENVVSVIIPAENSIGQLTATFKELRISAIKFPIAKGDALNNLQRKYEADFETIKSTIQSLNNVFSEADLKPLYGYMEDYDTIVKGTLIPLCSDGKVSEASVVVTEKLVPLGVAFDAQNKKLEHMLETMSQEAATELKSDVNPTITIVFIVLVLALNAFFFQALSKSIVSRVNILASSSDRLGSGDLAHEVEYIGSDELGKLRQNMNSLRENLHSIVSDMSKDANVLSASSSEMIDVSTSIDAKVNHVLDKLITVSSASEEMAATSQEISSNCNLAATNSEQTQAMAQEGLQSVENTVSAIRSHSEKTKKDAQIILELDKKTQEINSIITTIDDIASQTNLLALNAAIEAARAGEYGKGFAVVADEVRALAVRSAAATKQISSMINTVSANVKDANESITDTVNKMVEIAAEAEGLEDTLTKITNKVGEVNMEITQIATATEQQTSTSHDMSLNLQSIKEVTKDVADTAHQLENSSANFGNISSRMNSTVGKFTL